MCYDVFTHNDRTVCATNRPHAYGQAFIEIFKRVITRLKAQNHEVIACASMQYWDKDALPVEIIMHFV